MRVSAWASEWVKRNAQKDVCGEKQLKTLWDDHRKWLALDKSRKGKFHQSKTSRSES